MAWPAHFPTQGTVRWRCETLGTNLRRIVRTADGAVFTTSTTGAVLTQTNVIADCLRRAFQYAGAAQSIELQAGVVFDAPTIQGGIGGKAGDESYAYWASNQNGPFTPIQKVHIVSDPTNRARIRNTLAFGTIVKAANSTLYYESSLGGKLDEIFFYGINFHIDAGSPSDNYCCTSANAFQTAFQDVQGWIGWASCTFTGEATYLGRGTDPNYTDGRGFDYKTPLRLGFGSWDVYQCTFGTAGEHVCIYAEAPQGFGARIWENTNTSSAGVSKAICQRTACQFVQRGQFPILANGQPNTNNYGGRPGEGKIHIKNNTFHRVGWLGASAFTIAGFVGTDGVVIEGNTLTNCYAGAVLAWTVKADGGFTTLGAFEPAQAPFIPQNGQAWTTTSVTLRTLTVTTTSTTSTGVAASTSNPRSMISFRGVRDINIEFEGCSVQSLSGRPIFQFWGANPACAGQPGGGITNGYDTDVCTDPLDNQTVRFVMTTTVQPVSTYAGFGGASSKARYKNTDLSTAQLDALAYPNYDPAAISGDLTVDTVNSSDTHDEPDICWHPDTEAVMVAFNDRTPVASPGSDMDQRMRVFDDSGTSLLVDTLATNTQANSQWRPLISAVVGSGSSPAWLLNFTGGPNDNGQFNAIDASSPFAFATGADVAITDTTGRRGENDGCQLQDGSGDIVVVWNQVEGSNTTIRRRFYDDTYSALGASAIAVSVSGKNCLDPRIKADASRVWLVFHAQDGSTSHSNEYDGMHIYAAVYRNDGLTVEKAAWNVTAAAGLTGIGRRPEVLVYDNGKALVVWEHYPNGSIDLSNPSYPLPVYTGPSHIYVQAFDETGTAITSPIQVNSSYSAANSFALRPDLDISVDGTEVMICWTAAATCPPNGAIYSPATSWKLWARVLLLAELGNQEQFPMPEFRIESNQTSTSFARSWTRVTATNYAGTGGWAFTYRFANNVKARFFAQDGSQTIAYPPGSVVGGGSSGSLVTGRATFEADFEMTAIAAPLATIITGVADFLPEFEMTAVATPLADITSGAADFSSDFTMWAYGTVVDDSEPPEPPTGPGDNVETADGPSFVIYADAPVFNTRGDAPTFNVLKDAGP